LRREGDKEIMKGKRNKIFGVMMALVLAVALASVGVVSTAAADPGSLKWSKITTPEQGADGDYALWSDSNVGPIAVSPDGGTIFAASGADVDTLMRSTDDGYSWKQVMTKLDGEEETVLGPIVDIVLSPDWEDDDTLLVATEDDVYISGDRGVEFTTMDAPGGTITSLDATLDDDGRLTLLVGADDVYLMKWPLGGWVGQEVDDSVLDVAFSTNYATDQQIIAVVIGDGTIVRTKFGNSAWGASVPNVTLFDKNGELVYADNACISLADDYDAFDPTLFVGVVADEGDVYKIADGAATDLNVRDTASHQKTATNIWSIAVSGDNIWVGTDMLDTDMTPKQYLIYWSADGGTTWQASAKQPTGTDMATVVLGSAYVGTQGDESAFSASADGDSWNQRSLIDTVIDEITDLAPSPTFATDGTLYLITTAIDDDVASLWKTTDQGATLERVYCSTLTDLMGHATMNFDMIKLANNGGVVVAEKGTVQIQVSTDAGVTWPKRVIAQEPMTALTVVDLSVMYTGDTNGNVWQTTNGAVIWTKPSESDITGEVTSIAVGSDGAILAGDDNGTAYICDDKSVAYSFERVGPGAAGTGDTWVAFDTAYDTNDTIYAACAGSDAIYRFVTGATNWKTIYDGIAITGLVAAEDGTLYASEGSAGKGVARSVNPTSVEPDPGFDWVNEDLAATATLALLRVVPGGSNTLFAFDTTNGKLLTLTDTLTGKLTLVSPADESIAGEIPEGSTMASVVLSWEGIDEAEAYAYKVAIDPGFDTIFASVMDVTGNVGIETLPSGTTFYWKARVTDPFPSQWSDTQSFTTPLGHELAKPYPNAPEYGDTGVSLQPVLQWTGLAKATSYELQLAEDSDFTDLKVDKTGASALGDVTAFTITSDLDLDTTYYWRVRAMSATGAESPWSDTSSFTTLLEEEEVGAEATPVWVWVVIAIAAVLLIAVIVLIVRTRRAA
jgi:hypothetical protein